MQLNHYNRLQQLLRRNRVPLQPFLPLSILSQNSSITFIHLTQLHSPSSLNPQCRINRSHLTFKSDTPTPRPSVIITRRRNFLSFESRGNFLSEGADFGIWRMEDGGPEGVVGGVGPEGGVGELSAGEGFADCAEESLELAEGRVRERKGGRERTRQRRCRGENE